MEPGTDPLTVAILGSGAMARYWAFSMETIHPWVVGQVPPPYHIVEMDGTEHRLTPLHFDWCDKPPRTPDVVLLLIKWRRMPEAARWISAHAPQSLVISLMNGMGQDEALSTVPAIGLAQGLTTAAVTRREPVVYIRSHGQTLVPQLGDPRERRLQKASRTYGWDWCWVNLKTMADLRWQKLLQNSVINPLTALADCTNGEILERTIWQLARPLLNEGTQAARAVGVEVPQDMLGRVTRLARETRDNLSSMVQDVQAGLPTEIDAINGYIIRTALSHGITVPTHQALVRLIHSLTGG